MAAFSPHLALTLPFHSSLRPSSRWLLPAAYAAPTRGARVVLRGLRDPDLLARKLLCIENVIRSRTQYQKTALLASETDSPNTDSSKQNDADDDNLSSPDGPPVLTILAGIIVFLLIFWVLGSILTWIIGLVFGTGKS